MNQTNFNKKVFVYGDSISMQYGYPLKDKLHQIGIEYSRYGGDNSRNLASPVYNGLSTKEMLSWILSVNAEKDTILVFNCGLHDILHKNQSEPCQISAERYEQNLKRIVMFANEKFRGAVFCSTTPVDNVRHNYNILQRLRFDEDVREYNAVSRKIMQENGISFVDLYEITKKEMLNGTVYIDHIHVTDRMAEIYAEAITEELKECFRQCRMV